MSADDLQVLRYGERVVLSARIRRLIRWLVEHSDDVAGPDTVTITFDCWGNSVKVKRTEHDQAD